jgi:hypothetical protein
MVVNKIESTLNKVGLVSGVAIAIDKLSNIDFDLPPIVSLGAYILLSAAIIHAIVKSDHGAAEFNESSSWTSHPYL